MKDGPDDARTAAALACARALLERCAVALADAEDRAARNRIDAFVESLPTLPAPLPRLAPSMAAARDACAAAWAVPYRPRTDFAADPDGDCLTKAAWLRQRLGGAIFTGWPAAGGDYHAVLVLPIGGVLHVADRAGVVPVADFPFRFDGVYA